MTTLVTNITNLATAAATNDKILKTLINGNVADLSSLNTTSKSSIVSALNEVLAAAKAAQTAAAAGTSINDADAGTSTTSTYSANKITGLVNSAISAVTNGAPAALDTLKELADAIGDDASFSATLTTALGNRVRFDAAQTLTAAQKVQAKSNMDAYGNLEIGDPTTNFVTTFNSGLV
jgi:hypothetical protein